MPHPPVRRGGLTGAIRRSLLADLTLDVRHAARALRRSPSFTVVAWLTLTLGIGANVIVLGVLNAVMLRPLDVGHPDTLYELRHQAWTTGRRLTTSYPAFEDYRRQNRTFSGMAAVYGYSAAALKGPGGVREIRGCAVSGDYFDLLEARPQIGRLFHAADEHGPGSAPYVVISDDLWRSAFNADAAIVGTTVTLNGQPFTIIGVATAGFHGAERFEWPDYWVPLVNMAQVEGWDVLAGRSGSAVTVIGRLKPGVTPRQATDDLNTIAADLARTYPQTDTDTALRLIRPGLFGDARDVIGEFLLGVTALALLLLGAVCANLASLFAARAADRRRELAVRVALGSTRFRLVRQLLTEALLVSALGGGTGVFVANRLLAALNHWQPSFGYGGQRLAMTVHADDRVYVAAVALALGSAVVFGLLPAWQAWQSSPLAALKHNAGDGGQFRRFAVRDGLLAVQIAICTLLISASFVAVHGMMRALRVPLGIRPDGVLLAEMNFHELGRRAGTAFAHAEAMIEAARAIPGVAAVGAINATPMGGGSRGVPVFRADATEFRPKDIATTARVYAMSPGYLTAAGTRLLSGRDVSWQDTAGTPFVAVVNETFARKLWGERAVIGEHFILWGRLAEVVGIVEDGKYHDLTEAPQPAVFVPLRQDSSGELVLVIRSRVPASQIAAAVQHELGIIEPDLPITLMTWPAALGHVLFPARLATAALGIMGMLAAMLATTGVFGLATYGVSRRRKEIGVRVALGAQKGDVLAVALRRPAVLLGWGSAVGLGASILATRLLGHMVYRAEPLNPVVLLAVATTAVLIGLTGVVLPACRALRIEAAELLRDD